MGAMGTGVSSGFTPTQATTILAFKFTGGVLVAGDRRATAGNTVVYDRADKVLEIDRHSIMAIAGVPATAWEMARVLEHSLQYFRRTQLQEMSVDGKVRALSKLLRDNFGFVMQGIGIVVPIFATYDFAGGGVVGHFKLRAHRVVKIKPRGRVRAGIVSGEDRHDDADALQDEAKIVPQQF